MMGWRALLGSAFALLAVGTAVGLSDCGSTTRSSMPAGASAMNASPAKAGETGSSDGKPGAAASARSFLENTLLAVGAAVGLSGSGSTTCSSTPTGASVVSAPLAKAGETHRSDGKPGAAVVARSFVENNKLTKKVTGASPYSLLSAAGTGGRAANRSVDQRV